MPTAPSSWRAASSTTTSIERWTKKKRAEEREVRNRPHPYEIELYYGL